MAVEQKPIEKIKKLAEIQMRIFEIIDELTEYDVNLAPQKLRDAAMDVATGMGKIVTDEQKKDNPIAD